MNRLIQNEDPAHPNLRVIFITIFLGFLLAALFTFISFLNFPKIQILLGEIIIIVPAGVYVLLNNYKFRDVFRLYNVDLKLVGVSILLGISIIIITDEIDRIVSKFVKISPEFEELFNRLLKADSFFEWVILFISVVVLAGVLEEMLFRGMLQKAFERRLEVPYAIFFSALIFAMLHPPQWLIQVLILGLILGYLAWRSNSIIPSIILHWFTNAFALCFTNSEQTILNWYTWHGHVNPTILTVAACVTFYGLKWFYRITENRIEKQRLNSSFLM